VYETEHLLSSSEALAQLEKAVVQKSWLYEALMVDRTGVVGEKAMTGSQVLCH
jgi:hypothetical protein